MLALFLAAAVWCTVRQFWRLGGEPDETRRRQERIIALLYTVAQGVLLLLTAEAGFGLVALVLHIGGVFHLRCSHNLEAVRQGKALNTKTGGRSPGLLPLCLFGYPIR